MTAIIINLVIYVSGGCQIGHSQGSLPQMSTRYVRKSLISSTWNLSLVTEVVRTFCYEVHSNTKKRINKTTTRWECSQHRIRSCKGAVVTDPQVNRMPMLQKIFGKMYIFLWRNIMTSFQTHVALLYIPYYHHVSMMLTFYLRHL